MEGTNGGWNVGGREGGDGRGGGVKMKGKWMHRMLFFTRGTKISCLLWCSGYIKEKKLQQRVEEYKKEQKIAAAQKTAHGSSFLTRHPKTRKAITNETGRVSGGKIMREFICPPCYLHPALPPPPLLHFQY